VLGPSLAITGQHDGIPVTTKHEKWILRGCCFNDLRLFSREPISYVTRQRRIAFELAIYRRRIALKCYAMPRFGRIAAVLLVFPALYLSGQDKNTCNFVVQKVRFESAGGLTSEQREKLRDLVIGQCYDPVRPGSVGEYIQDQLRRWGYRKVEVYDLEKFQVLDDSVYPSLITLFIDLRVNDPSARHACPALEPRNAGYEDAMAVREVLTRNGVEVWCVAHSKMQGFFEGQLDAAVFATAQGRFEALFFPHEETLQNLLITY